MMGTMNDKPKNWKEGRRLRAWELHLDGWKQTEIADVLGVTQGAVSQWVARGRTDGEAGLRDRSSPGAPLRLTLKQRAELPGFLARGAEAFHFRGDVWTTGRIAEVIRREFGVRYHRDHVGRLLRLIGWSPQKPAEHALERDDAEIATWCDERWPEIKKKP
jgi:transposase